MTTDHDFRVGDRVTLSEEYRAANRGSKLMKLDRTGVVVGTGSRRGYVSVRWDGHAESSISTYHPDFLSKEQKP